MSGLELSLWVDRAQAIPAEAFLEERGALAVTLADAGGHPLLEPAPGDQPLWPELKVTGFFPEGADPAALLEAALRKGFERAAHRAVGKRDWVGAWQDDLEPMRFGRRLWVVPHACEVPAGADTVVKLDPGLAFGTGAHPTTALMLQFLEARELTGRTVLDFGCGSGILALAAAALGARQVWAVDIDPQACEATEANAAANRLDDRVRLTRPEELAPASCDLVVANILAGTLVETAPLLGRLAGDRAHLGLSGVLPDQYRLVEQAYAPAFENLQRRQLDDWLLVTGRRRRRPAPNIAQNGDSPQNHSGRVTS